MGDEEMIESILWIYVVVAFIAFICELIDSTFGMGYGTSLTPLLLVMGFSPLLVVPSILLSELITGVLAGVLHHSSGNVDFKPKSTDPKKIYSHIKCHGVRKSFQKGIPQHLKVVLVIASCSIIGTVAAVFIAVSIPEFILKLYIALLVMIIGIVILATLNKTYSFSWRRIIKLGLIASFNKGLSGGGYGPVVTGGQLLSGVEGKSAVGITSLAEGLTCLVGFIMYFSMKGMMDWRLAFSLIIGGVASVPLSVFTVKSLNTDKLRLYIGVITVILGVVALIKCFF